MFFVLRDFVIDSYYITTTCHKHGCHYSLGPVITKNKTGKIKV